MSEQLIGLALSNLAASAVLAGAAYLVHRHGRFPGLAHLLWVLVLLKLVTPPLLTLPLLPEGFGGGFISPDVAVGHVTATAATGLGTGLAQHASGGVVLAWALGSLIVLSVSLVRIVRFDRMLRRTSHPAPPIVEAAAREIGSRFGMPRIPTVITTGAELPPMTWWTGRRVLVVIPEVLVGQLTTAQLRWVLAHELAHVKRRDHVVRWLEWLACVSFWWNPIAWWARRNLHHDEEASCDAFVLRNLDRQPRAYAGALLTVIEVLARGAVRAPAVATGIDGGSLERRFALIMSRQQVRAVPRSLAVGILSLALLLMPLGLGAAEKRDPAEPPETAGLDAAVASGSSSLEAPAAGSAADDEPEYGMLRAALRPVDAIPAATEAGVRATPEVRRAERRVRIAERKLLKVERALERDAALKQTQRRLKDARQAVRKAEQTVARADGAPYSVKRDLREVRRSLRQATRELRTAQARG